MSHATVSPAVLQMNRELAAADPALVGNADLLAAVFSGSGDCIKILDLDGHLQFMSDGGKRVMEVDDFSRVQGCPWPDFWQGEGNEVAKAAILSAKAGIAARFSGSAVTLKGNPRYWDVQVLPVPGPDGKPTHLLSISRDITESKLAREEAKQLAIDLRNAALREADTMRRLFESAPSFLCTLEGPHHVVTIANTAFSHLIGPRAMVGRPFRSVLPELERQQVLTLLDRVYATGEALTGRGALIRLTRVEGEGEEDVFLNFVIQPVRDRQGRVTGLFIEGHDVTDLKRAEIALRRRELQLQLALDSAEMGVWEAVLVHGRVVSTSEDARTSFLLGRPADQQPSFETFVSRVHPDDRPAIGRAVEQAMDPLGEGHLDVEYRVLSGENRPERWIHARARVVEGADDTRLVGTVRDITAIKDAESQYALLNGELQHRIKNTLAMVSAIASQTLKGEAIVKQRDIFNARLHTLAHAHDLLMGEAQEKGSIREVIETALAPHRAGAAQFDISGPDLPLSPKQTLSLALAMHELATNAAKYGALSSPSGKIAIRWDQNANGSAAQAFALRWEEKNGPPVVEPTRSGFGSRLITRVLAADFRGQVKLDYVPGGLVCTLVSRFPVEVGG
ncbi:PAS domain-containing protein [Rhizobium sp. DKSPLA3]|uniref:Blue-light-activated histidine kinase n=1 Tax=Rhizobium quercicola TaxID=2901226 RepID=A0A9X1NQA8_9HYPH|nr:PAS domain-containing protein [Rhizobium quercicola]MCD7108091.1 PAS domain-containing protein [Rhizobium quercicola]